VCTAPFDFSDNRSCYTNHALDQFLELLLPVTKRIVRIGTRSKSEKLDKYNLFEWVNRQEDGTKSGMERASEARIYAELEEQHEEGNKLCGSLCDPGNKVQWEQIADFLRHYHPHHYAQLAGGVDEDGFTRVGKKRGNFFNYWKFCSDLRDRKVYEDLYGTSTVTGHSDKPRALNELLLPTADIWDFSKDERRLVMNHWEGCLRQNWIDEILARAATYQNQVRNMETIRFEYNRRLLENVDVIGLTTTGLASYAPLLNHVGSRTLICEEAGEVLEVGLHSPVWSLTPVSLSRGPSPHRRALHTYWYTLVYHYHLTCRGSSAIATSYPESRALGREPSSQIEA